MRRSFRETLKSYIGKAFLGSIVIFSTSSFFLLYPLVSDPDYYKNLILEQVQSKTGFVFDYNDFEPRVFPYPGIALSQVKVSKEKETFITLEELTIHVYFGVFIGKKLEIRDVILSSGSINLQREKDESFPQFTSKLTKETVSANTIQNAEETDEDLLFGSVFKDFPRIFKLRNVRIQFTDKLYDRKLIFYNYETNIDLDETESQIGLYYYGKLNEQPFQINLLAQFLGGKLTFDDLRFEGNVHFDDFSGVNLYDISVIFPYLDLQYAKLDAIVPIYKRDTHTVSADFQGAHLTNLARKGYRPFGDAFINVLISYDDLTTKLSFERIFLEWKGRAKIFGSGFVTFDKPPLSPTIQFEGRSEYIDADTVINVIRLFLDPDLEKSILTRDMPDTAYKDRMNVNLHFNLSRANLRGVFADHLNFHLQYQKSQMSIKKLHLDLYGGVLDAKGSFVWGSQPHLDLTGTAEKISLEKLLSHQFGNAPINGTLESNFQLNALGDSEEEIIRSLKIDGKFEANDGELLSYTNILKPISSIGSLISLKKIDFTRSTPYKKITMNLKYSDRKFQFDNFLLQADGLSGKGAGSIDLDKKIDMKFTIALPGITGRVLKLPIIYKGTYAVNSPYIDPIWLGSIYAGTILLAGPAGATVGGIAGSALSEYVDKAVSNVTETVQNGWNQFRSSISGFFNEPKNTENEKR
ncbi:AsmA-like C-terminal domain protein [Leptospira ryugenii]|uniref:AsmA-like C-terminal domain protein n=1 Tax=Leptospira ryugenii TaxID=1917863 RepID=A0A2P2E2B4_9LEPT|nr:AsmA family protein [Leptospira ryugenii]GBF51043.1 AsmA-like C-terminal domain protein [Leptospira ryugenii]